MVAFGVGTSRLVFVRAESGGEPLYHFAFDVPRNKFVEAKAWLAGRVDLLDRDGREISNTDHRLHFHHVVGYSSRAADPLCRYGSERWVTSKAAKGTSRRRGLCFHQPRSTRTRTQRRSQPTTRMLVK